ncbi:lipase [Gemmatimonadetes bacterium T265]|nr:lipase [Gemmatimonadetes bacterium T265]
MPIRLRPTAPVLSLAAALAFAAGCGGSDATAPTTSPSGGAATFTYTRPPDPSPSLAGRGGVGAVTAALPLPRAAIATLLSADGASGAFAARYDVQPYSVTYQTVGVDGALVTATGALYLPANQPAGTTFPVLVYQHGTVTDRNAVPSRLAVGGEGELIGAAYAADGFAVVLPDYLGYGGSTAPFHPYLHAATEASAAVDLLLAAKSAALTLGTPLDAGQVFVTGYSQGGHAAAALQRALERDYAATFTVRASAPMSGPYDLSGTGARLLTTNPSYEPSVVYGALLGAAMTRTYGLTAQLSGVFVPPADAAAGALITGSVSSAQLAALPAQVRAEFQPALLTALAADSAHPFWRALRDNDLLDWAPRAPTRLYYGGADRDVDPSNAPTAVARLRAAGAANVAAVNVGASLDHGGAVVPAVIAGRLFFDSVRAGLVH